ncbi:hypothetical protein JTB14_018726 [Gonioctena quinquepunctata]|nr:hypothetical protein JTB14_018726 [Gonioctena quinquepunctata]
MSKTRETTPEIEILKSPRTIYKELCESDDDNEITVFSTYKNYSRKEGEEQNILYYQENEVECTDEKKNTKYVLKQISETVDQSEDVMEFYESRYGKNEDFLNLQNEVREKTSRSRFPKHGNLPFRAICCNIM